MKTLRFIEKILIVLTAIGVIMKFTDANGGELFIVFPLLILSLIYFILGSFIFRERESKANVLWKSILAGIAFSFSLLGIMLKLEYLPLAQISLLIGMIGSISIMVIALVRRKGSAADEPKQKYYFLLVNRCTVMIGFSALFFSIPQSTLIRLQYRGDPGYAQLLIDYRADPEDKAKREKLYRYEMNRAVKEQGFQPGDSIYFRHEH